MTIKLFKYTFFTILFILVGCGGEKNITKIDNPEDVAIAFFDALYNEKDVKKAASVCSPQLARIIMHYQTPSAVGRHLFNMHYDNVNITPDDAGVKVREQFKEVAVIILYFDGSYNNNNIKDIKKISLIQQNGLWVIDKILKDPF